MPDALIPAAARAHALCSCADVEQSSISDGFAGVDSGTMCTKYYLLAASADAATAGLLTAL